MADEFPIPQFVPQAAAPRFAGRSAPRRARAGITRFARPVQEFMAYAILFHAVTAFGWVQSMHQRG